MQNSVEVCLRVKLESAKLKSKLEYTTEKRREEERRGEERRGEERRGEERRGEERRGEERRGEERRGEERRGEERRGEERRGEERRGEERRGEIPIHVKKPSQLNCIKYFPFICFRSRYNHILELKYVLVKHAHPESVNIVLW